MLEINDLSFGYDSVPILENISFALESQEISAVIGPNGSGKSTLLRCMDGLLKHWKGSISLNGKAINEMHRREVAKYIGYAPQNSSYIFPIKVFDMVMLGRYPHRNGRRGRQDIDKAFNAMKILGIDDLAMKNFNEISGGQQQKVTIARAIAQEAEILLLDEPTSSLDIMHQLEVMEVLHRLVRENRMAAIVSMHDLNLTSRYADKVIMLNHGRIAAAGEPFSVLTPENIASVYHVEVVVKTIMGRPYIVPVRPLSDDSC